MNFLNGLPALVLFHEIKGITGLGFVTSTVAMVPHAATTTVLLVPARAILTATRTAYGHPNLAVIISITEA